MQSIPQQRQCIMAKLTFILEDGQKIEVPLHGEVTIGQTEENGVVINAPSISPRHARIRKNRNGGFEVQDLRSQTGTFLNGRRIEGGNLTSGDDLRFGSLRAVFTGDLEVAAPRPTAKKADVVQAFAREEALAATMRKPATPSLPLPALQPAAPAKVTTPVEKQVQTLAFVEEEKESGAVEAAVPLPEAAKRSRGRKAGEEGASLTEEIQMLETRRATLFADLRGAQQRLGMVQLACGQAEARCQEEDARVGTLRIELERLQRMMDETGRARQAVEAAFAVEKNRLESMRSETETAQRRLEALQEGLETKQTQIEQRSGVLAHLQEEEARLARVTKSREETETLLERHHRTMQELERGIEEKTQEQQRFSGILADLGRECADLAGQRDQTAHDLGVLQRQQELLRTGVDELRRRLSDMEAKASVAAVLKDHREEEVRNLELRINEMEGKRWEDAKIFEEQMREHERVRRENLQELHQQTQRLEQLRDEVAMTEEKCWILQDNLERGRDDLHQTGERQETAKARLQELEQLRDAKEKQTAEVEGRLLELRREQAERESTLETTRQAVSHEQAQLDALRSQAAAEAAEMERRRTELTTTLETLQSDLAARRLEDETLTAHRLETEQGYGEWVEASREVKVIKARLEEAGNRKNEMESLVALLAQTREQLQAEVDGLRSEAADQTGRVELLRREEAERQERLQTLNSQEQRDKVRAEEAHAQMEEATREYEMQKAMLDQGIMAKRRELAEVEDALARWSESKGSIEEQYKSLQTLAEDSEEAKALWQSLDQEKLELGRQFIQQGQKDATILRGQVKQLETKLRRDEERFSGLRRKLETMELQEKERRSELVKLERRLAELRVETTRAERNGAAQRAPIFEPRYANSQPVPQNQEEEEEKPKTTNGNGHGPRGILAGIIHSTRVRLKPMTAAEKD